MGSRTMKTTRLIFVAAALAASTALAQGYPKETVRIIVPTAPGGGFDFVGRVLAEGLSSELKHPFIVENRTGAGTLVGTQAAATAPANGYTLLVGGLANMAFTPGLYKDPRYNPATDFVPVALAGLITYTLVARKDLPQSSLKELIDFAHGNPGKLTIAHAGTGTGQHVAAVLLKSLANVDLTEVAYRGAQPAYTDLLAGRVDLFFDATPTARPFFADGRVRPVVTSGSQRDRLLPNVPTGREAGLEGMVLDSWIGLFAPAKTPKPIIEQLRAAISRVLESADLRKRMEVAGWRVMAMSPAETEAFVKSEADKWVRILRQAGIKAQ